MRRDNWVRDAGVAGSNPATPTSFLSTYVANRDSYRDRNVPDYPPDPDQKCERAALAGSPNRKIHLPCIEKPTEAVTDLQAEKRRRLYRFCHATACTIASLAFAVSR